MDNRPIGVFDSGLGGLSVVRQLQQLLPQEDIVYFGDTGRVPYGTRSPETIEKYTRQDSRLLLDRNVKLIIAACGTVSSVAAHVLKALPVPAFGVLQPTAEAALRNTKNNRIGVIGTAATVRSGAFQKLLSVGGAQVFAEACPMLVPLVENGWIDRHDPIARLTVERYVLPLREQGIDTLILGCTHFPLLSPLLSDVLGDSVTLIDSGRETAAACRDRLTADNALADRKEPGRQRFFVSDRPKNFGEVAAIFLGHSVEDCMEQILPEEQEA